MRPPRVDLLKMLVLERYHDVGGMTLTEELTLPGFRSDVHASGYQLANFSPVPGELELEKHGLEIIEPDIVYAHAFPDGRVLAVSRNLEKTVENIGRYSKRDAETWRALVERYSAAKLDAPRTRDGRLPFPRRERLPVRLGKPPWTGRLDGPGEERGRDDLLRSRPRLRGCGRNQGNQVVV